jgi:hypothetical protein
MFVKEELGWLIFYGRCERASWKSIAEKIWKKCIFEMKHANLCVPKNIVTMCISFFVCK